MFDFRFSNFVIELLAAVFLFTIHLEWRDKGRKRFVFLAVLLLLFSTNTSVFNPMTDVGIKKILYYTIIICGLIACVHSCYRADWEEAVVIGAVAYTGQHFVYDVFMLCLSFLKIEMDDIAFKPRYYVLLTLAYVIGYFIIYYIFSRNFKISKEKISSGIRWVVLSIAALFLDVVFNIVFIQSQSNDTWLAFYAYDIVCTILIMAVLLYVSQNDALQEEIEVIRQMQRLKQEQYEISKENIELINIKCHDIRQQILNICDHDGKRMNQDFIDEIEKNINIYDSIFKTGNMPLDIILTEKSLLCNKEHIRLTCMADGERLDFIKESDMYSLFGNIIDNAIESARKLEEEEKRIINLKVRERGNLLNIQEENYYVGDIQFRKGVPVTSKQDKDYHGFGIKSIRMVVEKYHGDIQISAKEQVFSVNIIIPHPEQGITD